MKIYEVYQMPSDHPRYRDLFFMDASEVEGLTDAYDKVCLVDARSLEDVFCICNGQGVESGFETLIHRYAPMRSLSVGDIVRDTESNTTYLCAPIGWTILMAGTI
jgi:hypothetical protein